MVNSYFNQSFEYRTSLIIFEDEMVVYDQDVWKHILLLRNKPGVTIVRYACMMHLGLKPCPMDSLMSKTSKCSNPPKLYKDMANKNILPLVRK